MNPVSERTALLESEVVAAAMTYAEAWNLTMSIGHEKQALLDACKALDEHNQALRLADDEQRARLG